MSEAYALKYWWCSPPRTGIASERPTVWTALAPKAARDRNSPIKVHQINLQRSLIGARIGRFAVAVSRFGFAVGTPSSVATCRTFMTHLPRRGGSPRSAWPARDGRRCGRAQLWFAGGILEIRNWWVFRATSQRGPGVAVR